MVSPRDVAAMTAALDLPEAALETIAVLTAAREGAADAAMLTTAGLGDPAGLGGCCLEAAQLSAQLAGWWGALARRIEHRPDLPAWHPVVLRWARDQERDQARLWLDVADHAPSSPSPCPTRG